MKKITLLSCALAACTLIGFSGNAMAGTMNPEACKNVLKELGSCLLDCPPGESYRILKDGRGIGCGTAEEDILAPDHGKVCRIQECGEFQVRAPGNGMCCDPMPECKGDNGDMTGCTPGNKMKRTDAAGQECVVICPDKPASGDGAGAHAGVDEGKLFRGRKHAK